MNDSELVNPEFHHSYSSRDKNRIRSMMIAHQSNHGRRKRIRQKIFFVRHGVASHNVVEKAWDPETNRHYTPDQRHEEFTDANLVPNGELQACEVGKLLAKQVSKVNLIVSSPLTRCLRTASIAMQAFYDGKNIDMIPDFYCYEDLREVIGNSYANERSRRSVLQVRFSLLLRHNIPISFLPYFFTKRLVGSIPFRDL